MSEAAWAVAQLNAWVQRVGPLVDTIGPFELLEIAPTDDLEAIRAAYHRIAATRHPDLFRGRLDAAETEALMRVFGRVSGAYVQLRDPEERKKLVPRREARGTLGGVALRARSHVRKAEAMIGVGDYASAVLHLRMAVAADPQSKALRELLAETEARLRR